LRVSLTWMSRPCGGAFAKRRQRIQLPSFAPRESGREVKRIVSPAEKADGPALRVWERIKAGIEDGLTAQRIYRTCAEGFAGAYDRSNARQEAFSEHGKRVHGWNVSRRRSAGGLRSARRSAADAN